MNKVEILAPAGSFDSLIAAVNSGANAIYLGGQAFSARASATNFSRDELKKAVEFCHPRNIRIFVTVNTLFDDSQFEELIDYVDYLYNIQIDALIIQDIGFLTLVRKRYPDFEIHVSTQGSVYNKQSLAYFEKLGVKRVVLARENTLEEIREICASTDLEIEVFVHGALCISYSGQCLMSSMLTKRSGNKGACNQSCRLPYDLLMNDKIVDYQSYLLSPHDLCTIDNLKDLIDAGVYSLKIEGRMKRPEYVSTVVESYSKAVNNYYLNKQEEYDLNKKNMMQLFNRGYTQGFIFNDKELMSKHYPGNQGLLVGQVLGYNRKQKRVRFRLFDDLRQNDRINIRGLDFNRTVTKLYKNNLLVAKALKNDVVEIDLNIEPKTDSKIYRIESFELIKETQKNINKPRYLNPISFVLEGSINKSLTLKVYDNNLEVIVKSEKKVEKALNNPLSTNRIEQQLSKLGGTNYYLDQIDIYFPDNGIIGISELNNLRRLGISKFIEKKQVNIIHNYKLESYKKLSPNNFNKINSLIIYVNTYDQLSAIKDYEDIEIIYPFDNCDLNKALKLKSDLIIGINYLNDYNKLIEFKNSDLYPSINKLLVGDISCLELFSDKELILDTNFNIYNSYTASHFSKYKFVCSLEMTRKMINNLNDSYYNIVWLYGRNVNMNLKHCIISDYHYGKKNIGCNQCRKASYIIKNPKNELFPILTDQLCNNYILNCQPIFIKDFSNIKAKSGLLRFTIESPLETKNIVESYILAMTNRIVDLDNLGYSGYLF